MWISVLRNCRKLSLLISEKIKSEDNELKNKIKDNIIVKTIIEEFPDSEIIEVKNNK